MGTWWWGRAGTYLPVGTLGDGGQGSLWVHSILWLPRVLTCQMSICPGPPPSHPLAFSYRKNFPCGSSPPCSTVSPRSGLLD